MLQGFSKLWIFTLFVLLTPALVFADEQPPNTQDTHVFSPIVVTANKREESIQEVPSSISALDSTQIEDFRIEEMSDVFNATPNIYMTKTGPSASVTSYASVRGIASSMGGSQVLGIYVDDVYQPHLEMNLLDVERVEVLRGPQGTLYGRNTEAGVINVVTKQPTNTWEGKAGASYGSYNSYNFKGTLSGPIIEDKLLFRVSGNYKLSDSYFTNEFTDESDVNKYKDLDLRLKVMTSPEEAFRVALTLDLQDYWAGGYADFSRIESDKAYDKVNMDFVGGAEKKAYGTSLRAEYDFSNVTLLSVTSLRIEDLHTLNDTDFLPNDYSSLGLYFDNTNISQELRLSSNDDTAPYKWLVGAFAFHEQYGRDPEMKFNIDNMFGLPLGTMGHQYMSINTDTDTSGIAFFAQGSYTFWERLELTAGLRYDYLDRAMEYEGSYPDAFGRPDISGNPSKSFDALLPKVALSYKVNDYIRPYATVSRGYREGGFNYIDNVGEPYDSEFTWNYELGSKTQWFDNRLLFNVALFYIEWDDKQVEVLLSGPGGIWYFENAAGATSQGIEAEFTAFPIDGLEIMGSFGYAQAKYTEYRRSAVEDHSDKYLPDVPEYTTRLGGIYRFENGIFLGASYNYFGKIYYDHANDVAQNGYNLVDVKVGHEAENFEIYVYANNLFNEEYFTRGLPNAENNTYNGWFGRAGEPQTFGIEFSASF